MKGMLYEYGGRPYIILQKIENKYVDNLYILLRISTNKRGRFDSREIVTVCCNKNKILENFYIDERDKEILEELKEFAKTKEIKYTGTVCQYFLPSYFNDKNPKINISNLIINTSLSKFKRYSKSI